MDNSLLPWIFGAIALAGVIYFVYVIIFGGLGEADVLHLGDAAHLADAAHLSDAVHLSEVAHVTDAAAGAEATDAKFGCAVASAFMAAFGALGVLGSLSAWNLLETIVAAAAFGILVSLGARSLLRLVVRGQSAPITMRAHDLIGKGARLTIELPAGKTGEAMLQGGDYMVKYPVRALDGEGLPRGQEVEIVDERNGVLIVRKRSG